MNFELFQILVPNIIPLQSNQDGENTGMNQEEVAFYGALSS